LADAPDDLVIREKFCFLLVTLAKDELNSNNDTEAISLLTRARKMLSGGMPKPIISKVLNTLRYAYLKTEQYDEADQTV
jgi:hypothetical protein